MSNDIIQVQYEQLAAIAKQFEGASQRTDTLIARVQRNSEQLAESWKGQGGTQFQAEMAQELMPAIRRLSEALQQAGATTTQVAQVLREAEEQAAALFVSEPTTAVSSNGVTMAFAAETPTPTPTTPPQDDDCGFFCRVGRAIGDFFENIFGGGEEPAAPPDVTSVTEEEAQRIFDDMADEDDIIYQYPIDGCYARAHLMRMRMIERYNLDPAMVDKATIEGDPLIAISPYEYNGTDEVQWGWHIAPVIPVQQPDGTVQMMVIDPSLTSDGPMTLDEWKAKMDNRGANPNDPVIRDGNVYGRGRGGSWITMDDDAATDAANETMRRYRELCREAGHCK